MNKVFLFNSNVQRFINFVKTVIQNKFSKFKILNLIKKINNKKQANKHNKTERKKEKGANL